MTGLVASLLEIFMFSNPNIFSPDFAHYVAAIVTNVFENRMDYGAFYKDAEGERYVLCICQLMEKDAPISVVNILFIQHFWVNMYTINIILSSLFSMPSVFFVSVFFVILAKCLTCVQSQFTKGKMQYLDNVT